MIHRHNSGEYFTNDSRKMSTNNDQNSLPLLDLINLVRENLAALRVLLQPEQLDRLQVQERTAVLGVLQTTADTAWRLADTARILAGRPTVQPPSESEHDGNVRAETGKTNAEAGRARVEKGRLEGLVESLVAETVRINTEVARAGA